MTDRFKTVYSKGNNFVIGSKYSSSVSEMEAGYEGELGTTVPTNGWLDKTIMTFNQQTELFGLQRKNKGSFEGGKDRKQYSFDGGQILGWLSEYGVPDLADIYVNSNVFNHENRKKYLNNQNNNYYVQGWRSDVEQPIGSSSFKETDCMGTFIGDTERQSLIATQSMRYETKLDGIGWLKGSTNNQLVDGVKFREWDPTDARIFKHNEKDLNGNPLGRTARISNIAADGTITYPDNHIRYGKQKLWGGYFLDHLYKGTKWNGYQKIYDVPDEPDKYKEVDYAFYDETGQFEPINAAVQSKEIEPGKAKLRLKVERRDDDKGKK